MFTAALFTITKTWKQPKCPSTEEWIKEMWHIYTMEYYSAIEKNEVMPFAATWMDLEIVIPSEVSQKEKDKCISLTCGIYKNITEQKQTHIYREQTSGCQSEKGKGEEQDKVGY